MLAHCGAAGRTNSFQWPCLAPSGSNTQSTLPPTHRRRPAVGSPLLPSQSITAQSSLAGSPHTSTSGRPTPLVTTRGPGCGIAWPASTSSCQPCPATHPVFQRPWIKRQPQQHASGQEAVLFSDEAAAVTALTAAVSAINKTYTATSTLSKDLFQSSLVRSRHGLPVFAGASEEKLAHARRVATPPAAATASFSGGSSSSSDSSSSATLMGPRQAGELLQQALSSFDLFGNQTYGLEVPPSDTSDSEDEAQFGGQGMCEDIAQEHSPSAAYVGRAVYEVMRIDPQGKQRKIYVKRRDLLKANRLQPRDLRRIDPSLSVTRTAPSITLKESCLLINLGGVRAIITAERCLLFEPHSACSRQFLRTIAPRLAASANNRMMRASRPGQDDASDYPRDDEQPPPFELDMVEGALMGATGRLDSELVSVSRRVSQILQILPKDINPINLEELRRVKQHLVELESKAATLREVLEVLMDDEDELQDMNLSSRPQREEKRRQRERDRLEREVDREQKWAEELARRGAGNGASASFDGDYEDRQPAMTAAYSDGGGWQGQGQEREWEMSQMPRSSSNRDLRKREEEEGRQDAGAALEEMEEEEQAEQEVEEVEDLLEYYLQRAATTQSEAERLLAGARDLEESIGVSLSARRFEVNRLELTLSIGSFAAALGAMVAGIFGMNMTSTLEASILGFWGTTAGIVFGCIYVFVAVYRYMRTRRIL